MKKVWKILLIILAVILVLCGIAAFFLRGQLKAVWYFLRYDTETRENMISENDKAYDNAVEQLAEEGLIISDETKELLNSGTLTEEEALALILGDNPHGPESGTDPPPAPDDGSGEIGKTGEVGETEKEPSDEVPGMPPADAKDPEHNEGEKPEGGKQPEDGNTPVGPAPQNPTPSDSGENMPKPADEIPPPPPDTQNTRDAAAETIAKLYVLKAKFTGTLSGIESQIKGEYMALPKEERNSASRKSIAGKYIKAVADLETQCDAEVEAVLADLKAKLEGEGRDTAVIETLRNAYNEEKSLKKAYYMDVYANGIKKG